MKDRQMPAKAPAPVESKLPVVEAPAPAPAVEVKGFSWEQVETDDYVKYIANLRGIHCPEQTVRDIITADLDSAYAVRRQALERETAGSDASRQELGAKLEGLRGEEKYVLAQLLDDPLPGTPNLAGEKPPMIPLHHARPMMPLVLASIDPAALQLNEAQAVILQQVRQQFQEEIGTQNPEDLAYRERWFVAQHKADDRLRGLLGSKVYSQFQMQAANSVK